MDLGTIFQLVKIANSLAEYFKLVETIGSKVDNLAKSEYEAGLRALNQAANSNSETQSLLREARSRFNKAISLEKMERLVLAHLGLSMCHFHLGDIKNFDDSLKTITNLNFNKKDFVDFALKIVSDYPILNLSPVVLSANLAMRTMEPYRKKIREEKLQHIIELQQAIKKYLDNRNEKNR